MTASIYNMITVLSYLKYMTEYKNAHMQYVHHTPFMFFGPCFRPNGVVSEVRVRSGSLASEDGGARVWVSSVQSRLFQSVQRICTDGRQRPEAIHHKSHTSL